MSFLPTDYKNVPTTSNYMKLQEGDNKFRVLSSAIVGYEWWIVDNGKQSPVRGKTPPEELPHNIKVNEDGEPQTPRHFWAFVVWNYQDEKIQILELTQSSIQKAIKVLAGDEDWGNPQEYDILIKADGKGKDRRYSVTPKPKKPFTLTEQQANRVASINLDALYEGADPFMSEKV